MIWVLAYGFFALLPFWLLFQMIVLDENTPPKFRVPFAISSIGASFSAMALILLIGAGIVGMVFNNPVWAHISLLYYPGIVFAISIAILYVFSIFETHMGSLIKQNVGHFGQFLRLFVGAALIAALYFNIYMIFFVGPHIYVPVGIFLIITSIFGWCPIFWVLRIGRNI